MVIVGLLFIPRFYSIKKGEENSSGINVLSFNIRGGYSIVDEDKTNKDKNLENLKKLINSDIDILLFQEMSSRVSDWTFDYLPYKNIISSKRKGTLIATNYDVIDQGEIDFGTKVNSCVWADIKTPKGIIRVYNVHFQSNKIYEETEKAIAEGKEYNPKVFNSMEGIFAKFSRQGIKRIQQAKLVKAHIKKCEYDVLLGGDFNETPMSYLYNLMNNNLDDHFKKGYGYGATYPESSPIVRIDYLMSSKNISCKRFEILRNISLSDHLPIKSTIKIKIKKAH